MFKHYQDVILRSDLSSMPAELRGGMYTDLIITAEEHEQSAVFINRETNELLICENLQKEPPHKFADRIIEFVSKAIMVSEQEHILVVN